MSRWLDYLPTKRRPLIQVETHELTFDFVFGFGAFFRDSALAYVMMTQLWFKFGKLPILFRHFSSSLNSSLVTANIKTAKLIIDSLAPTVSMNALIIPDSLNEKDHPQLFTYMVWRRSCFAYPFF
jgi:hypothetical protein